MGLTAATAIWLYCCESNSVSSCDSCSTRDQGRWPRPRERKMWPQGLRWHTNWLHTNYAFHIDAGPSVMYGSHIRTRHLQFPKDGDANPIIHSGSRLHSLEKTKRGLASQTCYIYTTAAGAGLISTAINHHLHPVSILTCLDCFTGCTTWTVITKSLNP